MNKEKLVENHRAFLARYNLTSADVLVGAGGAMVMHGLRAETSDIDVEVVGEHFDLFEGLPHHLFGGTVLVREVEDLLVDVHLASNMGDAVEVEGVLVYSLERLLDFKLSLNREKDQADIKALRQALGLP